MAKDDVDELRRQYKAALEKKQAVELEMKAKKQAVKLKMKAARERLRNAGGSPEDSGGLGGGGDDELKVYEDGFKAPYRGDYSTKLLQQLDDMIKQRMKPGSQIYSHFVAVLQSSGFGKSRGLIELAKMGVFVFYVNCQEKGRAGYPLRSVEADSLLVRNKEEGFGLMLAVLEQLRAFVEPLLEERNTCELAIEKHEKKLNELLELQKKGRQEEEGQTTLELKRKIRRRKKLIVESRKRVVALRNKEISSKWTAEQVLYRRGQTSVVGTKWLGKWEQQRTVDVEKVQKSLKLLKKLNVLRAGYLKVLFVLDECSNLFRDSQDPTAPSSAYWIRRCFEHVPGLLCAAVDTKAELSVLAPPAPLDPSFRIIGGDRVPLPPVFTIETVNRPVDLNTLGASELSPQELFQFGRPLWAALLAHVEDSENSEGTSGAGQSAKATVDLLSIAVRKLLGGISEKQVELVRQGQVSLEAAMAVLSVCLSLAVFPQSYLAATLAGSYMSPLADIPEDRRSMVIIDAWDPVLAEAGKQIFAEPKFREAALDHLVEACQDYLVDEGKNGELACRYILLRAMVEAENDGIATVEHFLTQLLGEVVKDKWDKKSKRGTVGDLLGDLKSYVLNFNSFVPIHFVPHLSHLWQAYHLKKAIICKAGQRRFDVLIPIRGPEGNLSILGLQFKSYKDYKSFKPEASLYMDPLAAGIRDEFPAYVTVLLQVHPRRNPFCCFKQCDRKKGESVPIGKDERVTRNFDSIQKAFYMDGLESVKIKAEATEREKLEHLVMCRRLAKVVKKPYFDHLQCVLEDSGSGRKRKRKRN